MPKDYSQGIIYKITSKNTGRCYIGSTVQKLSMRMASHRRDYKSYKKGSKKYCSSYMILEDGNIKYECIAKNPCENLEQLRKAEGFYQKKYDCVNLLIAGRTKKEYRQDNKQRIKGRDSKYRQKNKEKISKQRKEYRQKNKEKINEKHICLCCGGRYTTQNWGEHAKTKKHVKAQAIQEQLQSLIPLYHQDSHFS